jgi:AraC family transcriptional regulator
MLEKLFRYALHCSIKEYMTKRRMTQAAKDLSNTGLSVTDVAMKYQYNSPEVFIRSFKQVWNTTPSRFTRKWKFTGLYPKHTYDFEKGMDLEMARKKVDISEAYEYFKERHGTYVICFDICGLTPINEISSKAGDLAILETASRIDNTAADDMLLLRIGGDEFALVTGLGDQTEARKLADRVLALNRNPIMFEGKEIPLSLRAGLTTIPDSMLRYNDFFSDMHKVISDCRAAGNL